MFELRNQLDYQEAWLLNMLCSADCLGSRAGFIISCESFTIVVPWCPHLQNGHSEDGIQHVELLCTVKELIHRKLLEQCLAYHKEF